MSKSYIDALRGLSVSLSALEDIAQIAETNQIPDRHGRREGQACDATCLAECATVARKALAEITAATSDDHDQGAPVSAQAGG